MRDAIEHLRDWPQTRVIEAMRAWRRGCGWLEPWFRATPFASAYHYRDRGLAIPTGPLDLAGDDLARAIGAPRPDTLWVFDLPGPLAVTVALALRRTWGMSAALTWNGWYDPDGALDGRDEIPLLLGLAERLPALRDGVAPCLVFDRRRREGAPSPERLDNRYELGDEDMPPLAQVRDAGCARAVVFTDGDLAVDCGEYVTYLRSEIPVDVVTGVALALAA